MAIRPSLRRRDRCVDNARTSRPISVTPRGGMGEFVEFLFRRGARFLSVVSTEVQPAFRMQWKCLLVSPRETGRKGGATPSLAHQMTRENADCPCRGVARCGER